jgi:drug/metabolite transporter (DMT)-like permease
MSKAFGVLVLALLLGSGSGLVAAAFYAVFNEGHYEREPAMLFMLVSAVMTVVSAVALSYLFFFRRRHEVGDESGTTRLRQ